MLLVELKLWASPHFFRYDFCWFFKLYLNGRVITGAGENVIFLLQAGIRFRLKRQKSKQMHIGNFHINFSLPSILPVRNKVMCHLIFISP